MQKTSSDEFGFCVCRERERRIRRHLSHITPTTSVAQANFEMSSTSAVARPFVVFLGWLGCQPKNLRRYETLYRGFEICTRIATPAHVIRATLTLPNKTSLSPPRTWPYTYSSLSTVEDLAWDILAEMDDSEAPVFFLHIFSNGGGFVWEALLRILAESHEFPGPVRQRLCSIEQRIAGVIIDSAPSVDFHRLPDALAWVSLSDKLATLRHAEPAWLYHWWWKWGTPPLQQFFQERKQSFVQTWTQNPIAVRLPMLFLYAANDPLCSPTTIRDMIQALQPRAQSICWDDSIHCGHLLRHKDEYQAAVTQFVQRHLERPDHPVLRSKL